MSISVGGLSSHAEESPLVGVLGGMGPAATADFFAKLVRATPAATDQEHLRTIVWSDPSIPDRSEALLGRGPDPLPSLLVGLQLLDRAGATIIAIPCATAHAFLPQLRQATSRPILSMIEATVDGVLRTGPGVGAVGLLATTGTVRAGLYQDAFGRHGVECLLPADADQQSVMAAIRLVKAGRFDQARQALVAPLRALAEAGAQLMIAACTELPLVLDALTPAGTGFDATMALADAVVTHARGQVLTSRNRESSCQNASV